MSDLYLDIRYRTVDAIIVDSGEVRFNRSYNTGIQKTETQHRGSEDTGHAIWNEGELSRLLEQIRSEAPCPLSNAHIILPDADINTSIQKHPRMPHAESLALISRKIAAELKEETPQIAITPMAPDQKTQIWLAEHISSETLKAYKREFSAARLKLRTVSTAINATLQAIAPIRESIFNAHAIFSINDCCIDVYYVSSTSLLLHETLAIRQEEDHKGDEEGDRKHKRQIFAILDLIYSVNSKYLSANSMTPLQKVWLCGQGEISLELVTTLQDAMNVDSGLLCSEDAETPVSGSSLVLAGLIKGLADNSIVNFMHQDLVRRFPLQKTTGILIYAFTTVIALGFIANTEFRHKRLKKQVAQQKISSTPQKTGKDASAALAKNMEKLKQLSSREVTFYPVFRELAMNLPDGVYLDTFEFTGNENSNTVSITAMFPHTSSQATSKTMTRMAGMMKNSTVFSKLQEPSVAITIQGTQKMVAMKFICEVSPIDATK